MSNRTILQNASMHLYFEHLAQSLNDAGFDMKKVLEMKEVDVPWNKDMVKEVLWKGIQRAMFDKDSTTDLTTVEISEVYKVLDRHTSEKLEIHVEWPNLRG